MKIIKLDVYDIEKIERLEVGDCYDFIFGGFELFCERLDDSETRGNFERDNKKFNINFFAPRKRDIDVEL